MQTHTLIQFCERSYFVYSPFMAPVSPVFYTVESMRLPCKFGKSLELGSTSIGSKPEPYPTKTESINRRVRGPAHLPDLCCIFYFQCLKRSHIISIIFVQKEPMFPPIIKNTTFVVSFGCKGIIFFDVQSHTIIDWVRFSQKRK